MVRRVHIGRMGSNKHEIGYIILFMFIVCIEGGGGISAGLEFLFLKKMYSNRFFGTDTQHEYSQGNCSTPLFIFLLETAVHLYLYSS